MNKEDELLEELKIETRLKTFDELIENLEYEERKLVSLFPVNCEETFDKHLIELRKFGLLSHHCVTDLLSNYKELAGLPKDIIHQLKVINGLIRELRFVKRLTKPKK